MSSLSIILRICKDLFFFVQLVEDMCWSPIWRQQRCIRWAPSVHFIPLAGLGSTVTWTRVRLLYVKYVIYLFFLSEDILVFQPCKQTAFLSKSSNRYFKLISRVENQCLNYRIKSSFELSPRYHTIINSVKIHLKQSASHHVLLLTSITLYFNIIIVVSFADAFSTVNAFRADINAFFLTLAS